MPETSETAILSRMVAAGRDDLSPEAARYILDLDFSVEDRERVRVLSQKARLGNLTQEEEAELDRYLHINDLFAIMRLKAADTLGDRGAA